MGTVPVVRAQYTAEGGRSVPSLVPGNTQPVASGFSTASDRAAARESYDESGGQLAPVSGSYAQQPVGGAAPAGDAGYSGQGVMNDFPRIGNDPIWNDPTRSIPFRPELAGTQTGRLMFGVGVNSDMGMYGSVVIDEQNFDWTKFPRGWQDISNATAWRGDGQHFRVEAMPGTELQRYMINFQQPYLFYSDVSLGLSGHYYTRIYREWSEERLGGQIALGYHFNHALTGSIAYRGMNVTLYDPIEPTPFDLEEALGDSALHGFEARLAHDTRDSQFLATEGHLIEMSFEQVIGTYVYPRAEIDVRKYFLLRQRPDGSGRHVLAVNGRVGFTDSETPIYEHYFPGGFSTIRGFDFRGAAPIDPATGVVVGGHFQLLASAEYLFPITADDMLRGVIFCDTGTAQPSIDDWRDKYRVSPGFGLRIVIPAMGPAPIALDFAFPAVNNPGDRIENFSFFVGFLR